jgi:hypothetical protein
MASGDSLLQAVAQSAAFPDSAAATPDRRNGHDVLNYDAATDESADFELVMPQHYAGTTGVTVVLYWMAATATTGDVVWDVSFERHADDAFDLDADGFAAVNSVTDTAASASGELSVPTVTFTDGADMDSWVAGESGRMRITRDANNGSDTMSGDAQILKCEIRET